MISVQLFKLATLLLLPIIIHARISSMSTTRYHDDVDNNLHDDRSTVLDDINKDIEFQITSSSQSFASHQSNINNPTSFTITIESGNTIQTTNGVNIDINDILSNNKELLFSEDYWYSFQPLKSLETIVDGKLQNDRRYKVHRILKQKSIANDGVNSVDNSSRRLQSEEEESSVGSDKVEESNSIGKSQDTNNSQEGGEEEYIELLTNSLLSLVCVTMAALAAGLTMGMLSLDPLSLEIKRRASPSIQEQQYSEQLLPLLVGHSKRHRLLVSLLLLNSLANEALPLFLDELFPSKYVAILVSVTLVLFFGEIVPSAVFTGPDQVKMAAGLVPLVKVVMFVTYPLAAPIAKLLDRVLHDNSDTSHDNNTHSGEFDEDVTEGNYYNRTELSALVRIQYESQLAEKRRRKSANRKVLLTKTSKMGGGGAASVSIDNKNGRLDNTSSHMSNTSTASTGHHSHHSIRAISNQLTTTTATPSSSQCQAVDGTYHRDEITMIEGALTLTTKRAADVCTPLRCVYALPSDTILDEEQMVQIWSRGYSRVPVYEPKADTTSSLDPSTSSFHDISQVVGVLLVRQLIVVDSSECRPISTLPLVRPPIISPSMHLVDIINLFQAAGGRGKGGLHLAIVAARPHLASEAFERGESIPKEAGVVGIITLEDVVEELLQEEIYDEADRDLELSRWGVKKWMRFVKKKKMRRLREERDQQEDGGGAATTLSEATPLLEQVIDTWQS